MRHTIAIAVVVALATAIFVDIVAAGARVSARNLFYYSTSTTGLTPAVPSATRNISPDLLPQ